MRFLYRNIFIFAVFSILILILSCKKDENNSISINGKIYDGNQNIPVVDAEVTFWVSRLENGTYNPNLIALFTVNTDAAGNYSFNLTKEKDASYRITIDKTKYFGQIIDIDVDDLPPGTHNLNYTILPEAYIKLHVKNVNYFDNNDKIGYSITSTQPTGTNCCNNLPTTGTGYNYENTSICKTYGAQKIKVSWSVKKNSINSLYDSLIYCVPFDTTTFDLIY